MAGGTRAGRPVVMVNNSLETFTPTSSGAIATWIWEVARAASAAGSPVRVLTRSSGQPTYPTAGVVAGLDVIDLRRHRTDSVFGRARNVGERVARRATGWRRYEQLGYARRVLRQLSAGLPFDVAVCHNDPELAVLLARAFPDAVVVHWFHNPLLAADRWRRRYRTAAVRSVGVSAAVARTVELLYELGPDVVGSVVNGVDGERFRPGRESCDPGGTVGIGFVGRTGAEKGPDLLLDACIQLARDPSHVPFSVQLVGANVWGDGVDTPYARHLSAQCDELRAAGVDVTTTGHLPRADIPAALARTAIHVVPSRWDEPCGLTLLEGMAAGCAVVASATGGMPEVVAGAGVLVPRDDVGALADALRGLLADTDRRRSLGQAARTRAEELTWGRVWDAVLSAAGNGAVHAVGGSPVRWQPTGTARTC